MEKKWSQAKMNQMLKDPNAFEKEYIPFLRQKRKFENGQSLKEPTDPTCQRLYNQAKQIQEKRVLEKQMKDMKEAEEAYYMAQAPKTSNVPKYIRSNQTSQTRQEVRNINEFMED
mmetsp:Transcript_1597/g.2818  ORF Transcript_1597/g.2818 Transcript_1597/m.2818 type:complete len:115 (-) Transcript_1597:1881-2225(-)